jgi:hypothetical protein
MAQLPRRPFRQRASPLAPVVLKDSRSTASPQPSIQPARHSMRLGRPWLIAGITLISAALLVTVLLLHNLDAVVKAAVEKYGSEIAGTTVRVEKVRIDLSSGRGELRGLTVANPDGFSRQPIFSLGEITLQIDLSSLAGDVPLVQDIRIVAPHLHYELNGRGGSNLTALQNNLKRHRSANEGGAEARQNGAGKETRLRIRRLGVSGAQADLDLSAIGGKRLTAAMPPVTLTEIGGKRGATPAVVGEAVLSALVQGLEREVLRLGLARAAGQASGKVREGIGGALKKLYGN